MIQEKIRSINASVPCDALAGIRVVELTNYVAAPMCGRMLADYGAEVIKIERPAGDAWRGVGNNTRVKASEDANPLFDILNSGKKSVVLDLKQPTELAKMLELLKSADVFLTNSRMKSLKKLGLDPESVMDACPSLVYAMITPYGIEGAEKDEPGFDSVSFWARSGFMRDAPYSDGNLPMPSPTGVGDSVCGVTLVSGILAALMKRARSGQGDFVMTSLLSSGIWVNNSMVIMAQPKYGEPFPISREASCAFACGYKCADGEWLQLAFMDYDRYMGALMAALGVPELIHDSRFADEPTCRLHMPELLHIFEKQIITKPCSEWLKILKDADIVCCRLPHYSDVASDAQAWENGILEEFTLGNGDTCIMPCPPVRFGTYGTLHSTCAPHLGENTQEVLDAL